MVVPKPTFLLHPLNSKSMIGKDFQLKLLMNNPVRLEKWASEALTKYDANHDGVLDLEET